jgi:drug resistance transporter, Bcr/CflA subfamily
MFKTVVSDAAPAAQGDTPAAPVARPAREIAPLQGWAFTLLLAALTALTALSIDMSLPALPQLQRAFGGAGGGAAGVQLTLSLFLVGYGIGQLVCGFLSDRYGRRPVLLGGLALFTVAGFACAFSPSLPVLIGLRLAQGFGASVGPILSRAMVRDRFGGSREAVGVLSQITQVMIIAPLLAPTLGGYLLALWGWPSIFLTLGATGALVGLVCLFRLPETLPAGATAPAGDAAPTERAALSLRAGLAAVFAHPATLRHTLAIAFASAGMFAYISASPFVLMEVYGVSERHFGYYFALTAAALLVGATLNRILVRQGASSRSLLRAGTWIVAAAGVAIAVLVGLRLGGMAGVIGPMMLYLFGQGLLQPNATALAMAPHARTAGAVSSVMGGTQTLGGALAAAAVGAFYNQTAVSVAATVATLAALTLLVVLLGNGREQEEGVAR